MMLYMERPKDFTKKLLELINDVRRVTGFKINQLHVYIPIMNY